MLEASICSGKSSGVALQGEELPGRRSEGANAACGPVGEAGTAREGGGPRSRHVVVVLFRWAGCVPRYRHRPHPIKAVLKLVPVCLTLGLRLGLGLGLGLAGVQK